MSAIVRQIQETVQRNCHIADARHGGEFGMCAYLLKMRELFRWEKGFALGEHLPNDLVGDWLSAREALWQVLREEEFVPLEIDGEHFDPFDAEAINEAIEPLHLVYSAGLISGAKPHFFLGRLVQKELPADGFALRVADTELARGLSAPPAMTNGRTIYLRREALRRYLWEKLESWRWNRPSNAFSRAMAHYPIEDDLNRALEEMTEAELVATREHEIGEYQAGELLGDAWNRMLLDVSGSPAELLARAVRDHIADCSRTLPMLVRAEKVASIHFFAGNLSAMRREIFPGLQAAYDEWRRELDLEPLQAIATIGLEHWTMVAHELLAIYERYGAGAAKPIEQLVAVNRL